mmetsp:Transcript_27786/g.55539  ORF Transcript_27786/g.55539 Transcript_27786/m.55539 type:complete len:184 (-) Transcript_27786:66-617(-)
MDRGRRAMPTLNRITDGRSRQRNQELHRRKLQSMRPSIDNRAPPRHSHLRRNLKKEKMMEERFATIERENRILLEKMSYIMQHNTLDNVNSTAQYSRSLNKDARKRELQRITQENQAILRRIQQSEPNYDHMTWLEEARRNEEYAKNISEFRELQASRPASRLQTSNSTLSRRSSKSRSRRNL